MDTENIWDLTEEERVAQELELEKLKERSILEYLQDQFDKLKDRQTFEAVQHNILKNDVQEIWTSFLLKNGEDVAKRLKSFGHDISMEQYRSIYNIFDQSFDGKVNIILENLHKSVLLDIDPNNSSQEAIESFLRAINNKYESVYSHWKTLTRMHEIKFFQTLMQN